MKLELTTKQFRRLLDMAYIGNWILNSTRGDDRFKDYDEVESLLFAKARGCRGRRRLAAPCALLAPVALYGIAHERSATMLNTHIELKIPL